METKTTSTSGAPAKRRTRPRVTEMEWADLPSTPNAIVRKPMVLKFTGVGGTSFEWAVRAGVFPEGVPLGLRARGWTVAQVQEMLRKLSAGEVDWVAINDLQARNRIVGRKPGNPRRAAPV